MSNTSAFFEGYRSEILTSINTAMPCKVLSFDEATCTAKIQPLFKTKEFNKEPLALAPIEDVPVLYQRFKMHNTSEIIEFYPHLQAGDVVQVVFNQRAIDDAQNGSIVYPGARMFSVHDAVIVGVFMQ
ncbi:Gp138 family membrane-puncturing spike protein [Solibacillus sp. FSL H8-0523]|uniref:Gp138 family membrane-puncturing spike protein n=1 Tax=Solibacillus sp. FSL H8-0523 TaxID=2954511 RepID=UPI0031018DC2